MKQTDVDSPEKFGSRDGLITVPEFLGFCYRAKHVEPQPLDAAAMCKQASRTPLEGKLLVAVSGTDRRLAINGRIETKTRVCS